MTDPLEIAFIGVSVGASLALAGWYCADRAARNAISKAKFWRKQWLSFSCELLMNRDELNRIKTQRHLSAKHARQCQLAQRRAKVMETAAKLREEMA